MSYVRKDADGDYKVVTMAGEVISRHSCRDWADQARAALDEEPRLGEIRTSDRSMPSGLVSSS